MRYIFAALALLACPAAGHAADWWEASTDHFVVLSETSKEEAQDLAVDLERFDEAMRYMAGLSLDGEELPEAAKLTVYQFGDTDDIGYLAGSRGVAGFFIPRAGQSVAFVPAREVRPDGLGTRTRSGNLSAGVVLFHEYAHYFMYQHAAAAYPAWYREGFAEVYGTVDLIENGFRIGSPATHRADVLRHLNSYPVEKLLDPPEEMDGEDLAQTYAMGWLLSHYLTFSDERKGQLSRYLDLVNEGSSSREAAKQAFGDLEQLNRDLDRHRRGRAVGIEVTFADYSPPEAELRKLTAAEEAMMSLHIQSTRGVDEDEALELVPEARELVASYSQSVPVLLAAVEAEFDAGNHDRAEALAQKALELDSTSDRAHLYLAKIALLRAEEDPSQFPIARREFIAANRIDPNNPDFLHGYYLTYRLAGQTPPEDALIALEKAYELAPFDDSIRKALAHLLLIEDRDREALILLGPIVNNPHDSEEVEKYRELARQIEAGDKTEALAELAPSFDTEEDEEGEG